MFVKQDLLLLLKTVLQGSVKKAVSDLTGQRFPASATSVQIIPTALILILRLPIKVMAQNGTVRAVLFMLHSAVGIHSLLWIRIQVLHK